ncbi:hypothetical protein [Thiolapillus sp.]
MDIVKNFASIPDCLISLYEKDVSCLSEVLEWHKDSLPGFTPEGFLEIIKYYLLYSLEYPESDVADYVVLHLSGINKDRRYWRDRYNLLSEDQRLSIAEFLNYMKNVDGIQMFKGEIDKNIAEWGGT